MIDHETKLFASSAVENLSRKFPNGWA